MSKFKNLFNETIKYNAKKDYDIAEIHSCPSCKNNVIFHSTTENCPHCGRWLQLNDSKKTSNVTIL